MPCHAIPYLSKNLPWSTSPAPSEVGGGLYETDASNVDTSLHDLCFRTLGRIKRDHTSCARADRTALFLSQEKSGHTTSLGMHTIHEFAAGVLLDASELPSWYSKRNEWYSMIYFYIVRPKKTAPLTTGLLCVSA